MGTGVSAAKRKAAKAAAAEYYKEFAKLKALPEIKRISTKASRELEDAVGNDASFRTRHLAKKADRLARNINKDDGLKKTTAAYNDRYSILKDQIANKRSFRYSVSEKPSTLPKSTYNPLTASASIGLTGLLQAPSLSNMVAPQKSESSFSTKGVMSKTKADAMDDAKEQMELYNNSLTKLVGTRKPLPDYIAATGYGGGYGGIYSKNDVNNMKVSDPSSFIKEEAFHPFGVLYRNLHLAEGAANDLGALSNNFTNSTGYKNSEVYASLAKKLKPLIKRDARNITSQDSNQSLVSNELASANPYTETIT